MSGTATLRLTGVRHGGYDTGGPYVHDPVIDTYVADLLAPYGVAPRMPRYARGNRTTYTQLAGAVVRLAPLDPLDLVIVAHELPDADPRSFTASYLARLCPGRPLSFAVSDQGAGAPYAALRVAAGYAARGGCHRILVLVMEQGTLPYDDPVLDAAGPIADHALALLVSAGPGVDGRPIQVRQRTGIGPDRLPAILALDLARAGAPDRLRVLCGRGVDPGRDLPTGYRSTAAAAGRWTTAAWAGLPADGQPDGARFALVDYDPTLGYLHTCLVGGSG
jgi:4-hydroxymandelate oxidase